MYKYVIHPQVNKELFYKQCERLEKKMSGIVKKRLLEDADGALIQIYLHPLGRIMVKNDELTGALYVQSDIDLEPFDALLRVEN